MGDLKIGSNGPEVQQIQQFLKTAGLYFGKVDGIFGSQTSSAIHQFQSGQGINSDGIYGSITRSKMFPGQQPQQPQQPQGTKIHPDIQALGNSDPRVQSVLNMFGDNQDFTNQANQLLEGRYDGFQNSGGNFYDPNYVKSLQKTNMESLDPFYKAEKALDTADAQSKMLLDQQNYDSYLSGAQNQFIGDKRANDVSSAQRGVLFSTSRNDDLNNLQNKYQSDMQSKQNALRSSVGDTARGYQYKFGDTKALSKYFKAGSNTYDAFASGGMSGSGGMSKLYNPSALKFQGTNVNKQKYNAGLRTSGQLWNQTNKNTLYSQNNQYL